MRQVMTRERSPASTARAKRHILMSLSWYSPEMHRGVAKYARDHRWHLTADLDDPVPKDWDGDGVITHLGAHKQLWCSLSHLDVPIVDLTESRPEICLPRVTVDNTAIGTIAADYFLSRGYRNLAMVHRWELGVNRKRRAAFVGVLRKAGLRCRVLCWQQEFGERANNRRNRHAILLGWLAKLPKPLAVFAGRDDEAAEVLEACAAVGLNVPEQVSVLGVDNTEVICECASVPLSSIDSNMERVGYEGAALLDQLMSGGASPWEPIYIAPSGVIERRSTDAYAVEHRGVAAALRFIQEHFHARIGVTEVAQAVGMSRSALEKAFREDLARPPAAELQRVRLCHAKQSLRDTDLSISAVAETTGFQTAHNLCRMFRLRLGMTPRQFRAQTRIDKPRTAVTQRRYPAPTTLPGR